MNTILKNIGFNDYFIEQYISNKGDNSFEFPARVTSRLGDVYTLLTKEGIVNAKVMGKYMYSTKNNSDYPVVGDYVIAEKIIDTNYTKILKVLPRKNCFSRKMPISGGRKLHQGIIDGGVTEEQVLASNIDYAMILSSLDKNFNISRLERYLLLCKKSNLDTVVILTKKDICSNLQYYLEKVSEIRGITKVVAISSLTGEGMNSLTEYLMPHKTILLLGSSGVGKSTLLNSLLKNDAQTTNAVSEHSGKGRHTTTHRQMFFHQSGCMIIDTPGMRELQLWADEKDLPYIFSDIIELSLNCKYSNCNHESDEGCAIQEAIKAGLLSTDRYDRYRKMLKEINRLVERKAEKGSKKYNRK